MVAAQAGVDLGGAAELGERDHQGILEQPAFGEVVEQGGHDVVQLGDQLLVGLEVLPVAVPPGAGHAHERDTRLDQPAGGQGLLAELGGPIAIADPLRLARDVEQRLAGHESADALIGHVVTAQGTRGHPATGESLAHQVAKLGALEVVVFGDLVETAEVLRDHAGGQRHGGVALAEEPGGARRHAAPFRRPSRT